MLKSQSFIFDGQSSDEYGVMLYFLDDDTPVREMEFGTNVEIIEDRPIRRTTPIHYGTSINKAMTFPIVFGSQTELSDYEVDAVLGWLSGHNKYKTLEYVDKGHYVKYKCFINDITTVFVNGLPTAFKANVVCDGQFAYEYPIEYTYEATPVELNVPIFNRSSYNGYYYPHMEITLDSECEDVYIINNSDNDRTFALEYTDRRVASEDAEEFSYITTLNNEYSSDSNVAEDLTWLEDKVQSNTNNFSDYNDILCLGKTKVLLPRNSNIVRVFDGLKWTESQLPVSGTFTGCAGKEGFVAILTNEETDIVYYSKDGLNWETTSTSSKLPVKQLWTSVCYAELDTFVDGYYIAVGEGNSAAVSLSGLNWNALNVTLPGKGWTKVKYGGGKAIAISSRGQHIAYCTNISTWHPIFLPTTAHWTDVAYGKNGWCLICDSVASNPQNPIFLYSQDGIKWEVGEMPIGGWREIEYANGNYTVLAGRTYAVSLDNKNWVINSYSKDISGITNDGENIIGFTHDSILTSTLLNSKTGSFEFSIPSNASIAEIQITGELENADDLNSEFISNGELVLFTQNKDAVSNSGFIALTQDVESGLGSEGVKLKAEWDEKAKIVTIKYICNLNHINEMSSALTIKVFYHHLISKESDAEDALVINIDNKNQIITTNKENLNMYPYFNNKFLRLLKGNNDLTLMTSGGKATIKIVCEFLRKAGGF